MKRMTDLGGFKPAVLIMVSVLAFIAGSRSAELTGLVEFSTDSSGNFFNGSVWNTRGGDTAVNLWVAQGTNSSGPFLNGPTDAQAGISLPLTLGENTFTLVASTGGFTPNHGLNLFFNGDNTNPRISVFAPTQTSNPPPAFSVNASASTLTLAFRPVAAANSLVFIHGDQRIELTDYRWAAPQVYNSDHVSQTSVATDGVPDWVGQITLNVTQVTPPAPTIVTQPASQTVTDGDSVTFSVTATGSEPITYQWRVNGADITGANASSLTLTNVQVAQAGNYSVVVANAGGSVTSADATLTVTSGPEITSATLTGLVEFSTDASGNFFNGSVWNTRGGDTAVDLWVVRGADLHGAFLNGPSDADCGISIPLRLGENTFTILASTGGFTPNHGLNLFFGGDNVNPGISVFGATQTSSTPPAFAANGSSSTLTLSFDPVAAANSLVFLQDDLRIELTGYRWAVPELNNTDRVSQLATSEDGTADFVGQLTLVVTRVTPTAPSIVTESASQTVAEGRTATFSVTAAGSHPFTYQWRFNGSDLAGATGPSLVLENVQASQAGNYSVVVSNSIGSVTSADALLTVTNPPPQVGILSGLVEFSTDSSGNFYNGSVWNTRGGDTAVDLWVIQGSEPHFVNGPSDAQAGISIPLQMGENVFTVYAAPGGFTPHHGLNLFFNGDNVHPGISVFGPTETSTNPPLPGFFANGSASTLTLAFEEVHGADSLVFVDGDLQIELTAYRFAVPGVYDSDQVSQTATTPDGAADFIGQFTLNVTTATPTAPSILTQPASQTVVAGGTASFSVTARGSHPLSYQWRLNGTDLSGATGSTLTLSNVQSADAGNYSVVVANTLGSVTSADATLTVTEPPPTTGTVLSGLLEFSTDDSGSFFNGSVWNTRGGDSAVDLWVIQGPDLQGPFVNGPSDAAAGISIALVEGENHFTIYGNQGGFTPHHGLNLFFNGDNNVPGISVFGETRTSSDHPAFATNGSPTTLTLGYEVTPGANSLIYEDQHTRVELTAYEWAAFDVHQIDRVSQRFVAPDGTTDFIGQFTLNVTRIDTSPSAPVAVVSAERASKVEIAHFDGTATVVLDGTHSSDPNHDPLSFAWFRPGDSTPFSTQATAISAAPVGQHTVTLVVSDGKGVDTASFSFEVITPSEAVASIINLLQGAGVARKNQRPLEASLLAALNSIEHGNSSAALSQLRAFKSKVQAQIGANPILVSTLASAADRVINALSGPAK